MDGLNKINCVVRWGDTIQNMDINMIIIAFSPKTTKIIPQILCGKWKHVAPIVVNKDKMIMYQFVKPNHIEKISVRMRDIGILRQYGWKFIYINKIW